jgi:hypothetical protein
MRWHVKGKAEANAREGKRQRGRGKRDMPTMLPLRRDTQAK